MYELINTKNKNQSRQKPPLSFVRITGEILAGTILCTVALVVAYVITVMLCGICDLTGSIGELHGFGSQVMFIIIFSPLYVIGSALVVYLVGNIGKQTGSFLAALGGGILGGLVMFLLFWEVLVSPLMDEKRITLGLILLIGPIMATIGFNLTRRYKDRENING